MEIVIHRVNTLEKLRQVPTRFGCEIDIRASGSDLILNHEPFQAGERFIDFVDEYQHGLLVLNIKEAGIENLVLQECRSRDINNIFLLDVEFPYLYQASRKGERAIALRYSEDESIDIVDKYRSLVDWIWIDTNTRLPLNRGIIEKMRGMKTCLVCPERWGRSKDIVLYRHRMHDLDFTPDAVMTAMDCITDWQ